MELWVLNPSRRLQICFSCSDLALARKTDLGLIGEKKLNMFNVYDMKNIFPLAKKKKIKKTALISEELSKVYKFFHNVWKGYVIKCFHDSFLYNAWRKSGDIISNDLHFIFHLDIISQVIKAIKKIRTDLKTWN